MKDSSIALFFYSSIVYGRLYTAMHTFTTCLVAVLLGTAIWRVHTDWSIPVLVSSSNASYQPLVVHGSGAMDSVYCLSSWEGLESRRTPRLGNTSDPHTALSLGSTQTPSPLSMFRICQCSSHPIPMVQEDLLCILFRLSLMFLQQWELASR